MRARRRLGMVLHGQNLLPNRFETGERSVEQRHVRNQCVLRQAVAIDDEAVILGGDHHAAAGLLQNRMIGAMMAEMHLGYPSAKCQSEELMPQADAEKRQLPLEQGLDHGTV